MTSFVEAVLGNALVAGVLAALALAVGLACRRPAVVHALWLLVLIKLVTPPLVHVPLPWPGGRAVVAEPAPPNLEVEAPFEEAPKGEPAADEEGWFAVEGGEAPAEALPATTDDLPAPQSPPPAWPWQAPVGAAWLLGSAAWFTLAAWRLGRFARLLRHARPAPVDLTARVAGLSGRLGLARPPRVWLVQGRLSPMVWAAGRATLLVPEGLLSQLPGAGLDTLLAHELAHVRRRDHWVRWLELIGLGLYWWNPVVWLARRELRQAEELCCDAWVVRCLPDARRVYATALVDALDFLSRPAEAVPALGCGLGRVDDLKRRLTMILRGTTPHRLGRTTALGLLALAGLLLPLVPGLTRGQATPEKKDPAPETPFRVVQVETTSDLHQLDPKTQAEITALIKKRLAEQKAQLDRAMAEVRNVEKLTIRQLDDVRAQQPGGGKVADLEKLLQARQAEVAAIKQKIGIARKLATARPATGRRAPVTIHLEVDGGVDLQAIQKKIEKALEGEKAQIRLTIRQDGGRFGWAPGAVPPKGFSDGRQGSTIELHWAQPDTKPIPPAKNVPSDPSGMKWGPFGGGKTAPETATPAERRIDALEKKLDAVLRELERVRRGMKETPSGTTIPGPNVGVPPTAAPAATPPAADPRTAPLPGSSPSPVGLGR